MSKRKLDLKVFLITGLAFAATACSFLLPARTPFYDLTQPGSKDSVNSDSAIAIDRAETFNKPKAEITGKEIFEEQCASCHGADGQGVKGEYDYPLEGDQTLDQLAELIDETMPEEDPDACVDDDARKVGQYVFDRFYLPERKATESPRIRLSRLTENQYRNSVADLLSQFSWRARVRRLNGKDSRGLTARYYNSRGFNDKKLAKEKIDDEVDFDFANKTPTRQWMPDSDDKEENEGSNDKVKKKGDNKKKGQKPKDENKPSDDEFSIFWRGGIIAPATGAYEFVVDSPNGFRLYVNDQETPAIDRWVSTGETTHRVSIFLLGGRVYPIRLNFFKYKDKSASIRLSWKPPHDVLSVIDKQYLVPDWVPPVGLVTTPFPVDDSSTGYRRGISVSQQWDEATTRGAVFAANWVVKKLQFHDRRKAKENTPDKLKAKFYRFVSRAFCRPLSDQEKSLYVDKFIEADLPIEDRIKRIVILTLKSPHFLFPNAVRRPDEYELASRIALYLQDSVPDQKLFESSGSDLKRPPQIRAQIKRLLDSQQARIKIDEFFEFWLSMNPASELAKDKDLFPGFDKELVADLRRSLRCFISDIVWSESSDFRQLYLSKDMYLNIKIFIFYDLVQDFVGRLPRNESYGSDFFKAKQRSKHRVGILTHPYLLMNLAYYRNSSPIHRGVFVARNLWGRSLKPPPNDVEPLSEEFDPKMTTRERVEHQTKPVACMKCHSVINPLGFSLENYDAVGRYRKSEKQKPVDSRSTLQIGNDVAIEFHGPADLAKFLATDERAQKNFIRRLFQHLVKQPVEAFGQDRLDLLHEHFVENEFSIRELIVQIVFDAATHGIELEEFNGTTDE